MPLPRILEAAWEDIAQIAEAHLVRAGSSSATRTTDKILDAIALLESMPYLGPLHQDDRLAAMGYRKLIVMSYVVVYRLVEETPTVYRVFYGGSNYAPQIKA